MHWPCPVSVCRWVRWRWTASSNPSASRCSASWSRRRWKRWTCRCRAASAWGATATSGPSRRAAPRTTSAYRCGPHLPHVQPPRWGLSRAVLVSNARGKPEGGRKGRYIKCTSIRSSFSLPDAKPLREPVFHQGAGQTNQPQTTHRQRLMQLWFLLCSS